MRAAYAFWGLTLRPASLLAVPAMLTVIAPLVMLGPGALSLFTRALGLEIVPPIGGEGFTPFRIEGHLLRIVMLLPAGIGWLGAQAVHGVLLGSFAWTLPRLRRRLLASMAAIGVASALFAAILYRGNGGQDGWLPILAQGVFWFGAATACFDVVPHRRVGRLVAVGFAVAFFALEGIADAFEARPALLGAAASAASAGFLLRLVSDRTARAKSLIPTNALGSSFRWDAEGTGWSLHSLGQAKPRAAPSRKRRVLGDWVVASFQEQFGWRRGGWPAKLAVGSLASTMWIWGYCVLQGVVDEDGGSVGRGFATAYHLLFLGERPPWSDRVRENLSFFLSTLIGISVFVLAFEARPSLRAGVVYPISRRERAEVAWRCAAVQSVGILAAFGGLFLILGAVARRFVEIEASGLFLPSFARALLAATIVLPGVQYLRLTRLTPAFKKRDRFLFVVGVIAVFLVAGGAAVGLDSAWCAVPPFVPAVAQAAAFVLLVVAAQAWLRAALRRYHVRADLV